MLKPCWLKSLSGPAGVQCAKEWPQGKRATQTNAGGSAKIQCVAAKTMDSGAELGVEQSRQTAAQNTRSKQYSSITAATAVLPFSCKERTTLPEQFTSTSLSVPSTTAGRTMRKRMTVPTPRVVLVWKRTPPAEMSAVSAKYSWASAVRTVMGSLSGNRTELRESFTPCTSQERLYTGGNLR